MGRTKKTSLSKAQKTAMRKIAEKVVDAEIEDKAQVTSGENLQLYHNIPYYIGKVLQTLTQGVNDGEQGAAGSGKVTVRVGDQISLKNINIRFWLSNKKDRPNCMYKGCLFWLRAGIAPTNALVFSTQQNKMLDRYNDKDIKIVDKFIVKSTNNYAVDANNHEHSYLATLNKSYKNKKITFDGLSGLPKGWDLCFSLVCYDAFGTLQTDNISSFAFNSKVTFQDA